MNLLIKKFYCNSPIHCWGFSTLTRIFLYFSISFLLILNPLFGQKQTTKTKTLRFEILYETLQPLFLKKATLYISPDKILGRSDSLKMYVSSENLFQDTLLVNYHLEVPVHATIKLEFFNHTYSTEKFYLDPIRSNYLLTITDTSAIVKAKPKISFSDKDNYLGIILLFQILLELIIASLLVRFFRWPAWVILVVLVSNLAAFPVSLLNLQPEFISDLIMLLIKFIVIFLTGRKRLGITRIIILVFTLTLISFGFKEIFILVSKVL